jgi:hypothetical protein
MGQYRTFMTAFIIYFLFDPVFSVPQLYIGLIFNPANLLLAFRLRPMPVVFGWLNLTTLVMSVELCAFIILYYQIAMTDIM